MKYTIEHIADNIYSELDSPTDLSIAFIHAWLRSNVGNLNNLIGTTFAVRGDNGQISPELEEDEMAIFMQMYLIHHYDKKIQSNLGASAVDSVIEVVDSIGGRVRLLNKNEIARSYIQIRKDTQIYLNNLVNLYKLNRAVPLQVVGKDETEGDFVPVSTSSRA